MKPDSPSLGSSPLRIAVVVNEFPLVSQTFVVENTKRLVALGHDVTILALGGRAAGKNGYEFCDAARVATAVHYGRPLPSRSLAQLAGLVRLSTTRLVTQPRRTWQLLDIKGMGRTALRSLYAAECLRELEEPRFDVIHAQFGWQGRLALHYRDCGLLSGPLVTHLRGADITKFVRSRGIKVYADLFARGELFLANCKHMRAQAIAIGSPRERTEVFYSGIDLDRFPPCDPPRPDGGPLRLLSVGRLTAKKGFADAIRAIAEFVARGGRVAYTIVGDGPEREALIKLCKALDVDEHVTFAGARSPAEIPGFLGRAQVFVGPSVTADSGDQDAPINVLKEAMAMQRPVIGTRHGGIPELVEHGRSGLLVEERDPEGIRDALHWLVENPDSWATIGREARRKVETDFNSERLGPQLVSHYRRAIQIGSQRQEASVLEAE